MDINSAYQLDVGATTMKVFGQTTLVGGAKRLTTSSGTCAVTSGMAKNLAKNPASIGGSLGTS